MADVFIAVLSPVYSTTEESAIRDFSRPVRVSADRCIQQCSGAPAMGSDPDALIDHDDGQYR
jgi:hypothetical protein